VSLRHRYNATVTSTTSSPAPLYDPSDLAFVADPYPTYRRLREEAPVYWWEAGHSWLLSRYDDVVATLKDPRLSTDIRDWSLYQDQRDMPAKFIEMNEHSVLQLDRRSHARIRKLVSPSLNPRAVVDYEPLIEEVITELLDDLDETEVVDFAKDFAEGMPIRVIRKILGIPAEHDALFRSWGATLTQVATPMRSHEERVAMARALMPGFELLEQLIEQRRVDPTDDMLSALIHAQEQEERLTAKELVSLVGALITAGSETTVHLVIFALLELFRHPEVMARVRNDPSLIPGVLEESLRHDNFSTLGSIPRYPLEDIEIRGQTIRKGEMIMCVMGAAMHDERMWPDAEEFDIERDPIPNISFGRGSHFCMGAHLARLEGRIAIQSLLARYPEMSLAGEPEFGHHAFARLVTALPVRLRPAETA